MWFSSDNAAPAAPAVLEALARANEGPAGSYGADPWTARATALVREIFEAPEAVVLPVVTGTAANSLALATLCPPWAAICCHEHAHVQEDECGAPIFYTGGATLWLIPGAHARIDPDALERRLAQACHAGVHNVQRGAVTVTQATELGTLYRPADLRRIADIAGAWDLPLHMDGARFANAAARLGVSPAELTWKAGVQALSLGATKNGALGVEAVVFFGEEAERRGWEFELRRKRGGHLLSKMRYASAQLAAWLEDGLWLELAARANAAADRLAEGLRASGLAQIPHPVEANMVFPTLPRAVHARLQAAGARYYPWPHEPAPDGPDDEPIGCRLVCAWNTADEDIDAFLAALRG